MDSSERMYSMKEAGAILGVSPDTVKRRIDEGMLKAWVMPVRLNRRKRVYRTRRILESEIRRFIASSMTR